MGVTEITVAFDPNQGEAALRVLAERGVMQSGRSGARRDFERCRAKLTEGW
jgi:hypothetical protein